jgi:tetratricopeptide (TPR) repeat protein
MLTTRIGRLALFLVLIAAAISLSLLPSPRSAAAQDPDFEDEINQGKILFRQRKYDDALKSFKRANDMREKKCGECYGWMTETYLMLEAYKNVIDAADKAIEFAGGDNQLLLKAYNNKGLALQASADKKDQKKLAAAEEVFRAGMAIPGASPILRYNLGVVLMQLNRDDEGVAVLKEYLKLQPRGGFSDMARKLAENPRRARENFAPDFSFTSQQGEYISLDDLKGKVVVLDFWGTWCPPCGRVGSRATQPAEKIFQRAVVYVDWDQLRWRRGGLARLYGKEPDGLASIPRPGSEDSECFQNSRVSDLHHYRPRRDHTLSEYRL